MDDIILDLDGTVADNTPRIHLLPDDRRTRTEDWELFNNCCHDDIPIEQTIDIVTSLKFLTGRRVIVVTSRGATAFNKTRDWLDKNKVPYDGIYMRPVWDHRDPVEYKRAQFEALGVDKETIIFDDDRRIVEMATKEFGAFAILVPTRCVSLEK